MVVKTETKSIGFSIEHLMRPDNDRKERRVETSRLTNSPSTLHLCSERLPISSQLIATDLRADEELSECSDISVRLTPAHNSTCSTPGSDTSASMSLNPTSDSSLDFTGTPILTRRKKARTAFTQKQIDDLEKRYHSQRYLSATERGDVAEELDLTDQQVKTWFQNRRMKEKRQKIEKSDGPAFPTGGVDVAQLHALGIPCPLPPNGAPQYKHSPSVHPAHGLPASQYMPMPMFPHQLAYHSTPLRMGSFPMFQHPYLFPFNHQIPLPMPKFGSIH